MFARSSEDAPLLAPMAEFVSHKGEYVSVFRALPICHLIASMEQYPMVIAARLISICVRIDDQPITVFDAMTRFRMYEFNKIINLLARN